MRLTVTLAFVACLAASPAAAQLVRGSGVLLDAAQVRAEVFGIDMEGHTPSFGFSWRECIDPDGRTLYETPAGIQRGQMVLVENGMVCFSYDDDGHANRSCYNVSRTSAGFVFEGAEGSLFIATRVVRGVKSCKPNSDLIG